LTKSSHLKHFFNVLKYFHFLPLSEHFSYDDDDDDEVLRI